MDSGVYRVEMDGRWSLKDLYEFPHAYMQVYAFAYAFDTDLPAVDSDRINYALESYPWAGGYSVVNIYSVLQSQVSPRSKPVIKEIRYASPGWLDSSYSSGGQGCGRCRRDREFYCSYCKGLCGCSRCLV